MALSPDQRLASRVERLLGRRAVAWRRVEGGYTPAERWIVECEDGLSAFVKTGRDTTESPIAGWLRAEQRVYANVRAGFLPEMLGWEDDGAQPVLVLEDLSHGHWPPPWRDGDVEAVLEMLERVHATTPPAGVPPATALAAWVAAGWSRVVDNPEPFLSLHLCSKGWLGKALPMLLAASAKVQIEGSELVHLDVRSDNICFASRRALLVDWNIASVGNGKVDVAFWLPSLQSEGGPAPEAVLPYAPELAALVSGFFAARAGLPLLPQAPRVRTVQMEQLRYALPWAVRALGLPPLDS